MMKRKIDVRIDQDLIDWLDQYAQQRRWTRTQALVEALMTFKALEEGPRGEGNYRGHRHASP